MPSGRGIDIERPIQGSAVVERPLPVVGVRAIPRANSLLEQETDPGVVVLVLKRLAVEAGSCCTRIPREVGAGG